MWAWVPIVSNSSDYAVESVLQLARKQQWMQRSCLIKCLYSMLIGYEGLVHAVSSIPLIPSSIFRLYWTSEADIENSFES